MPRNYNIRIGKTLQDSWNLFLAAPEIYVCVFLALMVIGIAIRQIPGLSWFSWTLMSAFTVPATVLIAEASQSGQKATFACLKPLTVLAPQLIVLSLLKTALVTIGMLLFLVPGIIISVWWVFAEIICTLEGKTFWESMQASRELVRGNWFTVAGLCFVVFLVIMVGLLFLGVGLLVTAPIGSIMMYAAFKDIHAQLATTTGGTVIDAEIVP